MHTIKIEDGKRKWVWNFRVKKKQAKEDIFIEIIQRFTKLLREKG